MNPLDSQQRASAEQFERQSANYGRSHILAQTDDVRRLLEEVKVPAKARALDVATGGGHTALCLARAGFTVTLGDLSAAMLRHASTLLREEGFSVEAAEQFPAEMMPFDDAVFDLVSCRVAPHHFSDPARFVREVARVLRPGGCFLLIDGSVPDDDPETAAWLNAVEKWRDPSHGRLLAREEWEELCAKAGLTVRTSFLQAMFQPDLEWYFETAGTTSDNRERVLDAIATASPHVRAAMELSPEGQTPVQWTWQRLSLLSVK